MTGPQHCREAQRLLAAHVRGFLVGEVPDDEQNALRLAAAIESALGADLSPAEADAWRKAAEEPSDLLHSGSGA
jgi:hypothetical protein